MMTHVVMDQSQIYKYEVMFSLTQIDSYTVKYLQKDAYIQVIMYIYISLFFQLRQPNSNDIRILMSILNAQMLVPNIILQ